MGLETMKMMKRFSKVKWGLTWFLPAVALLGVVGCGSTSLPVAPASHATATSEPAQAIAKPDLVAPLILQPTLLDAAVAFKFAARLKDTKTIEVRFQIAPGYYMYKDKFRATVKATAQTNLAASAPLLPAGAIIDDPGFGKVETYRQVVFFDVPLNEIVNNATSNAAVQFTLIAQGCADVGVCYPPQRHSITFNAVGDFVGTSSANATGNIGALNSLSR